MDRWFGALKNPFAELCPGNKLWRRKVQSILHRTVEALKIINEKWLRRSRCWLFNAALAQPPSTVGVSNSAMSDNRDYRQGLRDILQPVVDFIADIAASHRLGRCLLQFASANLMPREVNGLAW